MEALEAHEASKDELIQQVSAVLQGAGRGQGPWDALSPHSLFGVPPSPMTGGSSNPKGGAEPTRNAAGPLRGLCAQGARGQYPLLHS